MTTQFEAMRENLESRAMGLDQRKRGLFLLAYSQRLLPLFRLFEKRVQPRGASFDRILNDLWQNAMGVPMSENLGQELQRLIPGEEWVVDGFHDAIAQDVGGLAVGAVEGLGAVDEIDGWPETAIFDLLRHLVSEMRLSCSDPGDNPEGVRFESDLHKEQVVIDEAHFWQQLLSKLVPDPVDVDDLRTFAMSNSFDPVRLEPELSRGLAQDGIQL